jgi:surfactin synthase thioesterase subunit
MVNIYNNRALSAMSKRRGKILSDAESIERRKWYSDLQRPGIEAVEEINAFHKAQSAHEKNEEQFQIKKLAEKVDVSIKFEVSPWILPLNKPSPSPQLATVLCFHGLGQNHSHFNRFQKPLTEARIQLCAVCLPGRSNRSSEECFSSVSDTAVAIFLALKAMNLIHKLSSDEIAAARKQSENDDQDVAFPAHNTMPLVFYGQNLGCIIAFEVISLMQNYHFQLPTLIASGCPSAYVKGHSKTAGKKYCYLSDDELLQRMVQLGGVPSMLIERREFFPLFIDLVRCDYYLYDRYCISPPANTGIVAEAELNYLSGSEQRLKLESLRRAKASAKQAAAEQAQKAAAAMAAATGRPGQKSRPNPTQQQSLPQSGAVHTGSSTVSSRAYSPSKSPGGAPHHHAVTLPPKSPSSRRAQRPHLTEDEDVSPDAALVTVTDGKPSLQDESLSSKDRDKDRDRSGAGADAGAGAAARPMYPAVLHKLHTTIVTLRAEDDLYVTAKDAMEWARLCAVHDHISLSPTGENEMLQGQAKEERLPLIGDGTGAGADAGISGCMGPQSRSLCEAKNEEIVLNLMLKYCGVYLE